MKYSFLAILVVLPFLVQAQSPKEAEEKAIKHELKINLPLMLVPALDVAYEYALSDASSFGLMAYVSFYDDPYYIGGVLPYYRGYFSKEPNQGFFVEVNMAFGLVGDDEYNFTSGEIEENTDVFAGLGFGAGWKFVNRNNIIGEFVLGLGRAIGPDVEAYPRVGIYFGKRF